MTYEFGEPVRIRGEFTRVSDGVLLNPTTVKVSVRQPGGKIVTYTYGTDAEVIRLSTGIYYMDVAASAPGRWAYRWFAEGTGATANEGQFDVRRHRAVKGEL